MIIVAVLSIVGLIGGFAVAYFMAQKIMAAKIKEAEDSAKKNY